MIKVINYSILLFLSNLFGQSEMDRNYEGEVEISTWTDNLSVFSTQLNDSTYFLYTMDRNDSIYFRKQYELQPIDVIVSQTYNKIFVCFYDQNMHGESYSYKVYNLNNGADEDFPTTFAKFKMAKGGKYLHASTNLSGLVAYNIETKEYFRISLQDWIRVTSMSGNRLVILQQLSERNKKKMAFEVELRKKREIYIQQSKLNRISYSKGETSESRFIEIEDSLKNDFKSFNKQAPKGTWTQLGTRMWIYDLDKKEFIYNTEIKDQSGNIIIISGDDHNSYSLSVDENDNILIYGQRRNSEKRGDREKLLLKYDKNYKLLDVK